MGKAPQMIFEKFDADCKAWEWEGKMPGEPCTEKSLKERGFEYIECAQGDLVCIHGQVDHLSLPNTSSKPRETFRLHLVEGPSLGITWSDRNWLQYPQGEDFPSLKGDASANESRKRKAMDSA